MKWLVIGALVTILAGAKSDNPIPNYLQFIGSFKHNTTSDGKFTIKKYYGPSRLTLTWIDANMACQQAGMRIAYIESPAEVKNLVLLSSKNSNFFNSSVHIREKGISSFYVKSCTSYEFTSRARYAFSTVSCDLTQHPFLCEDVAVAETFDSNQPEEKDFIDVRATFFSHVGDYDNKETSAKKSYYASLNYPSSQTQAQKICSSFGMSLASPQSQDEYDKLVASLKGFKPHWDEFYISGYRSWTNNNEWVSSGEKLKYAIAWSDGEPNNIDNDEHCIALNHTNNDPKMIDHTCRIHLNFLCEWNHDDATPRSHDLDFTKYLKPLVQLNTSYSQKQLFLGRKKTWFDALNTCKFFGMDLFIPESLEEHNATIPLILKIDRDGGDRHGYFSTHTGLTSQGLANSWYMIHSGKVISNELDYMNLGDDKNNATKFVTLKIDPSTRRYSDESSANLAYETTKVEDTLQIFICQRVLGPNATDIEMEWNGTPITSWIFDASERQMRSLVQYWDY